MGTVDYQDTMAYLSGLQKFGIRLGLHRIRKILEYLGNPEKEYPWIHVGGTNGKGSVTAMLSTILQKSGYRVGTYISPSLHRFNERICIDGNPIQDHELMLLIDEIRPISEKVGELLDQPTEFEVVTALALEYFRQQKVDIAVIEVGLGGRLDSTNVVEDPRVAVITGVGYDHMNVLGDTLEEIAGEKAGIIKANRPVVVGNMEPGPREVILQTACCQKAPVVLWGRDIEAQREMMDWSRQLVELSTKHHQYQHLELALLGDHQIHNAALAVAAIDILATEGFTVSEESIRQGLMHVKWPARFEVMQMDPIVVIDGAHNPDGIRALKKTIQALSKEKRILTVVGILADKDWNSMIRTIADFSHSIYAVTPRSARGLPSDALVSAVAGLGRSAVGYKTVSEGIQAALAMAQKDDVVCICGSLVTAAEARTQFVPTGLYCT